MATILAVDDDPDVVDAIRLFLEKEGHTVASAYNRDEGMKSVDRVKPDLLILDVMMEQPDDGMAMAQELRRKGFAKPILLLTSVSRVTGMKYDKDDAVLPVEAFVEKPIEPKALVKLVDELLQQKEG
ncbi:MAG TPA: response regulator [Candidatus Hydrogenedentes bacterium]|nr:response regulator [Candidatus Hydrogenedentota bacterium]HOS02388.1 response regulator [Candidatus Hydrogenedentota bacterium]